MSRTQLFERAFSIMMRSGPLWAVALAVGLVNMLIGETFGILLAASLAGTLITTVTAALTGAFGAGALILIANTAAEGQAVSFADGFRAGVRPFRPMAAVYLILAIPTLIYSQIIGLFLAPLVNQISQNTTPEAVTKMISSLGVMLFCLLPLLLVGFLLVAFITNALGIGAARAVALEEVGVGSAFKRGWALLTGKFSDFVVISLIMLAIGLGFGILFGCGAVVIALASSLGSTNLATSAARPGSNLVITIIMTLLTVPADVFFSVVWTLAFRRWQGKDGPALAPVPVTEAPPAVN